MLMTPIIQRQAASVRLLLSLIFSIAALILVPCPLKAQTLTSGDFAGTVEDASGAVIPGADVKASNTGTGAVNEVFTGAAGDYRISLLQPGEYKLTVSATGFQTTAVSLALSVGQIENHVF